MIKEGFKIIFYNNRLGYVLFCTFQEETSPGFYVKVVDALNALDEVRKEHGFRKKPKGMRLKLR